MVLVNSLKPFSIIELLYSQHCSFVRLPYLHETFCWIRAELVMHSKLHVYITPDLNGYVYNIAWLPPRPTKDLCAHCSSPLTLEDRSHGFILTSGEHFTERFKTVHQVSKCTGISYSALRNACTGGNKKEKKENHRSISTFIESIYCSLEPQVQEMHEE